MARSVPEWIGKTDDTEIPDRVRVRVFNRDDWCCKGCGRRLRQGDNPQCDHVKAVINGGKNRESNLQTLCKWCHAEKTGQDVAQKAVTYQAHRSRAGLRKRSGRAFQTNRNGKFKKKVNGEVVRR